MSYDFHRVDVEGKGQYAGCRAKRDSFLLLDLSVIDCCRYHFVGCGGEIWLQVRSFDLIAGLYSNVYIQFSLSPICASICSGSAQGKVHPQSLNSDQ